MKLFLAANCLCDNAPDAPNSCLIDLSKADLARIEHLANLITEADAYCIESLAPYGTWSNLYVSEVTDESLDDATMDAIASTECRVEAQSVIVRQDGFYFTCAPKNGSDSELCKTSLVPYRAIVDCDVFINSNY